MPNRPSHLPPYRERAALLLLRDRGELPLKELHPTGLSTIAKMVGKIWIERVGPGTYRITSAGELALKAKLPVTDRRKVKEK